MRDLELWRLLGAERLDEARLLPLVEELEGQPEEVRRLLLAGVARCLESPSPALRLAACRAFRGLARGYPAQVALAARLDDAVPEVRAAAVDALLGSTEKVETQDRGIAWVVHLHPRDDVRRAAVAHRTSGVDWWLRLLGDAAVEEVVWVRLREEPAALRTGLLPLWRRARTSGRLRELAAVLAGVDWRKRGAQLLAELDGDAAPRAGGPGLPEPPAGERDPVAQFVDDFWELPELDFGRLAESLQSPLVAPFRWRLTAAAHEIGAARGFPAADRLALAAGSVPQLLVRGDLPVAMRREALARWSERTEPALETFPFALDLLGSDLCRDGAVGVDLASVGKVLAVAPLRGKDLATQLPAAGLLAAAAAEPRLAIDLFGRLCRQKTADPEALELLGACLPGLLHDPSAAGEGLALLGSRRLGRIVAPLPAGELPRLLAALRAAYALKLVWGLSEEFFEAGAASVTGAFGARPGGLAGLAGELLPLADEAPGLLALFLQAIARRTEGPEELWEGISALDDGAFARLVAALGVAESLPSGREEAVARRARTLPADQDAARRALARALAARGRDDLAQALLAGLAEPAGSAPAAGGEEPADGYGRELGEAEIAELAALSDTALGRRLLALPAGTRGVCRAVMSRPGGRSTRPEIAAGVLASGDPTEEVAVAFLRHAPEEKSSLAAVDRLLARRHGTAKGRLPHHLAAWLHHWDRPLAVFAWDARRSTLPFLLRRALWLSSLILGEQYWRAADRLLMVWSYREPVRLDGADLPDELLDLLVAALAGDEEAILGVRPEPTVVTGAPERLEAARTRLRGNLGTLRVLAARMWITLAESGREALGTRLRKRAPRIGEVLPGQSREVLELLGRWIDTRGLRGAEPPPRVPAAVGGEEGSGAPAATEGADGLAALCRIGDPAEAADAARQLLALGAAGEERLVAAVFARAAGARGELAAAVASVATPAGAAALERAVAEAGNVPEARGNVALARLERLAREEAKGRPPGKAKRKEEEKARRAVRARLRRAVVDALGADGEGQWLAPESWSRLLATGFDGRALALELATSPQEAAYDPAVRSLLESGGDDAEARARLRDFLECGNDRRAALRCEVAELLARHGDPTGLPLLVGPDLRWELRAMATGELLQAWRSALMGESDRSKLRRLFREVEATPAREEAARLLLDATDDGPLQERAVKVLAASRRSGPRDPRVARLARTCLWGMRRAVELTGRSFEVRLVGGAGLGFTAPGRRVIHVNPLPLMRGDPDGEAVLQALMLHELGHHVWHQGPRDRAVWEQAERRGLHELLNLVADEHLERNLRALDARHGERLQKLAAWAFQHSRREVWVRELATALRGPGPVRLGPAREDGWVTVRQGTFLLDLEAGGSSFARFVRALRMGLGDRHGDPKVAAGLALFRGPSFRRLSVAGLLRIAERLREIFGEETAALSGALSLRAAAGATQAAAGAAQAAVVRATEGLTEEELQEAIAEALAEERRGAAGSPADPAAGGGPAEDPTADSGPRRAANPDARFGLEFDRSPDEEFDRIARVTPLRYDVEAARRLAAEVGRWSSRLRERLERLGTVSEPERGVATGRRVDQLRLRRALVTRDPRILVRRRRVVRADLFLGVAVDCSGSMEAFDNIAKARRFGALVAHAARHVPGLDVRVVGFTDQVIYDAGDARRCAAHAFEARGGNNDAAALWYLSRLAAASRRSARLLVMVSDGRPTECTVGALRALVRRLARDGFGLVQAAVYPIAPEDRCFPRYVEICEEDLSRAVAQFGRLVAAEVGRVVRRG